MNIVKLQIIVLIEKYKKVTEVAAELGLKQPTVSFHMKSLETELGVSLFQYRSGRVLLTDAGKSLYQYAVKIVALTAEAERNMKQFTSLTTGTLVLEASQVSGNYVLPKILSRFAEMYPGLDLALTVQSGHLIRERLRAQEIQLGVLEVAEYEDYFFNTRIVAVDEPVLVFAPDHPIRKEQHLSPEQAARELWIEHEPRSFLRDMTAKWATLNDVRILGHMAVNSPEVLKRTLREGRSIGLLPKNAIKNELEAGTLAFASLPGESPGPISSVLAWQKDYTLTPLQEAFVELAAAQPAH
ncbi:LysR family transcriptional regulator [Paenibacillus sp. NFR01]|uniref:LysR family transcriptional regulator n=1 Tax=Paenibacillus sp. NFR01 TaxID=1566279 RepID=UPI0008C418D6|nr:LysR family transcriptional regulator [Paenibacillus sp. NFR01]SET29083.1 DNA-binding transcriptional regulator, LysR family [Paenibacillus sp. NFR01]